MSESGGVNIGTWGISASGGAGERLKNTSLRVVVGGSFISNESRQFKVAGLAPAGVLLLHESRLVLVAVVFYVLVVVMLVVVVTGRS